MNETVTLWVRRAAQAILDSLGHSAPRWTVFDVVLTVGNPARDVPDLALVSQHSGPSPSLDGPGAAQRITVVVGPVDRSAGEAVAAYFPLHLPAADAVADLASQLQDHVSESVGAWGRPLPPCPGHSHAL